MYKEELKLSEISKSPNLRFGIGYSKLSKKLFFRSYFSDCPLRLKDICYVSKGDSITQEECGPGEIPVVAGGKSFAYYNSESNRKAGVITVSASGAYAGYINYWDVDIWASDCSTIRSKNEEMNITKFWFYLLRLIQSDVYHFQTGAGQPHVYPFELQNIRIPDIPISYQKEALDRIKPLEDNLNEERKKVLLTKEILDNVFEEEAHTDVQLRQGMTYGTQLLNNARFDQFCIKYLTFSRRIGIRLSARASNPVFEQLENKILETGAKRIGDVVSEPVHNGATPKYDPSGTVPVIKVANITNEGLCYDESESVGSQLYLSLSKAQIKKGDIVVCNIGKGSLGKVDYCESDDMLFATNETMIIRVDTSKYHPRFLCYFLRSIFGVYQFEREYTGTTNQIHIDPASVSCFLIPDISLEEQERIVNIIEEKVKKNEETKQKVNRIEKEIINIIRDSAIKWQER